MDTRRGAFLFSLQLPNNRLYPSVYRPFTQIQFCRNISIAPAAPPKPQNIRFFIGQQTADKIKLWHDYSSFLFLLSVCVPK